MREIYVPVRAVKSCCARRGSKSAISRLHQIRPKPRQTKGPRFEGYSALDHANGRDRRVATVHGLANGTALGLNLMSIVLRGQGRRGAGRLASGAGWLCMFVGGYL